MRGRRRKDRGLAERDTDQLTAMIDSLVALRSAVPMESHPTVYAIRSLIADAAAMLPLVSLRGTERLDPQPSILRRPDPMEPRRQTIQKLVNSATRTGNAFLYLFDYDREGWPLAARALPPGRVTAVVDYEADAPRITGWQVAGRPVALNRIKHIPFNLDPGPLGTSPLQACTEAFATLNGLWAFAASYWVDGGTPPYALKHPRRLTAEQASEFLNQWVTARQARRPGLLSDGLELETYATPSASDALLLDGLNYFDAALARAFRVPPSIVNVLSQSSLTYATTTDEMRRWLALALYPGWLSPIEAAFTDLTPRGQTVIFDTSNLVRTDYAARVQTGAAAIGAGLLTVDEWRAQEGLPPIPLAVTPPVTLSASVEGI